MLWACASLSRSACRRREYSGGMYFPVRGDLVREKAFAGCEGGDDGEEVEVVAGGVMILVEALMGMGVWGENRVRKLRRRGGSVRARAMWWWDAAAAAMFKGGRVSASGLKLRIVNSRDDWANWREVVTNWEDLCPAESLPATAVCLAEIV